MDGSMLEASIVNSVRDGKMLLTMKESARFDYMRWMIGYLHPWFSRMEWEVIEAEEGSAFVTTDSPVSFYNPECPPPGEAGVALAGTKIFFPLSSRHLLLMRHPECRSEHTLKVLDDPVLVDGVIPIAHGAVWNHEVVTSTNWKLSQLAHHFVVAESETELKQCGCLDWPFPNGGQRGWSKAKSGNPWIPRHVSSRLPLTNYFCIDIRT
ncbi:MAG: DUF4238 domain-containing protein [Sulfuricella sp.]|nr:DUF4238 domain-containing protein [Sulfuricella sp.]